MGRPLSVYLDTQDYSRFGDVLRGRGDERVATIFEALSRYQESGEVVFVFSMPLLSELIQYSQESREICFSKAEAIERLCGPWALPFPTRLIAMEIAIAMRESFGTKLITEPEFINCKRYWYPNIDEIISGLKTKMMLEIDQHFEQMASSMTIDRRNLRRIKKKLDIAKLARQSSFSDAEEKIGIPAEHVRDALVPLFEGKISSKEAGHRIFSAIAFPTTFIKVVFERYAGDASAIPHWMSGLGKNLKSGVEAAIAPAEQYFGMAEVDKILKQTLDESVHRIIKITANAGIDSLNEFVSENDVNYKTDVPDFLLEKIKSANSLAYTFKEYLYQVVGLRGNRAKFEKSFGGDLIHLLYLPHVDLWRGDRRVASLINQSSIDCKGKVVGSLFDLPVQIERALEQARP